MKKYIKKILRNYLKWDIYFMLGNRCYRKKMIKFLNFLKFNNKIILIL